MVKVPLRNHRFSVGVTDMVIVLGVVFLDPPVLVIATGVGIAVSQLLFEAQPVKRLFNVPSTSSRWPWPPPPPPWSTCWPATDLLGGQLDDGRVPAALAVVWVLAMAAFFLSTTPWSASVVSLSTGQGFVQSWLRAAVAAADWAASIAYGLIIAALLVHDQALLPLLSCPSASPSSATGPGPAAWPRASACTRCTRPAGPCPTGSATPGRSSPARWPTCSTARGRRSSSAATRTAYRILPAAPTG